jgi:hypothetical protein
MTMQARAETGQDAQAEQKKTSYEYLLNFHINKIVSNQYKKYITFSIISKEGIRFKKLNKPE